MGTKTGQLIECRCGVRVPLLRQTKKVGEGRYYYVHPDKLSAARCRHAEYFNPDIDNLADLEEIYRDVRLSPIAENSLKAQEPLMVAPEPEPEPLLKAQEPLEVAPELEPEPDVEAPASPPEKEGGGDDFLGLGSW
jgi:hypothetical protein